MNLNHVTIIVTDLERSAAFYRVLGLSMIVHEPPRYARFTVPDGRSTLSTEVTEHARAMGPEQSHIYFECDDLDERCASLAASGLQFVQPPTDMPYLWREAWLRDPDGHDIRLYCAGVNRLFPPWRIDSASPGTNSPVVEEYGPGAHPINCVPYDGPREQLRHLFDLADDSAQAVETYFKQGNIYVAELGNAIVGHVQIVDAEADAEFEIKSIAVVPALRERGIGTELLEAALRHVRKRRGKCLSLFTSIAAFDSLGFYLRRGFRVRGIVRDAFTIDAGYPAGAQLNGISLNDAVELELPISPLSSDQQW